MNITLDLTAFKNMMMDMSEIGAAKYAQSVSPKSDSISEREAYRKFGRANVEKWVNGSLIKENRMGSSQNSKKNYSYSELLTVHKSQGLIRRINDFENTLSFSHSIDDIARLRIGDKPEHLVYEQGTDIEGILMRYKDDRYAVLTQDNFNSFKIYKEGSVKRDTKLELKLEKEVCIQINEWEQSTRDIENTEAQMAYDYSTQSIF